MKKLLLLALLFFWPFSLLFAAAGEIIPKKKVYNYVPNKSINPRFFKNKKNIIAPSYKRLTVGKSYNQSTHYKNLRFERQKEKLKYIVIAKKQRCFNAIVYTTVAALVASGSSYLAYYFYNS